MSDMIAELNDALTGRYEVEKEVGQGGMATVYLARDVRHDRKVAIKVLLPELAVVLGPERFVAEMKVTANLQHPHILPLFDSGTARNQLFYVMPFVDGESLRDRLTREQQLPIDDALRITTEVASALDYAHRHGVVHRDIKPENILLHDGTALVTDFGIALAVSKAGGARLTQTGLSLGTPQYMSPEQATGERTIDGRTDVYSLGCVLYEMLTGEPPFTGPSSQAIVARVLTEPVRPLRARRDTVSQPLEDAVLKAVQKLPADRFATPAAFAEALRVSGALSAPAGRGGLTRATAPRRRTVLLVAAVVTVAVLALGFALGKRAGPSSGTSAAEWRGELLGGPQVALYPQVSPDGQSVAFAAMVNGQTQAAVLSQRSGDWRVLTSDRSRGSAQNFSWAEDNSKIYFDRFLEVPKGVFSISPLGTGERLVLEDAASPKVLADGSLLVTRMNGDGNPQLFRYWPENSRLDTLPVIIHAGTGDRYFVVFPDGREAAFFGRTATQKDSADRLYAIDLTSKRIRRLAPGLTLLASSMAATPDNQWVVVIVPVGNLARIAAIARDGSDRSYTLASLPSQPFGIDVGRDGSLYFDQVSRPAQLRQYAPGGRQAADARPIANFFSYFNTLLALPDGRTLVEVPSGGEMRVMVITPGKESSPFMGTDEATSGPLTLLGRDHVALLLGSGAKRSVAIVAIATGQLAQRLPGILPSGNMAGSPDGKTLYYVDSRVVWSVPIDGGKKATRLRDGDAIAIDPQGQYLIVAANASNTVRLFHVPLNGGPESEIAIHSNLHLVPKAGILASAVSPTGQILVNAVPTASWFWPMAILDPRTGTLEVLPPGTSYDGTGGGWTSDGRAVYITLDAQSVLWRFRPVTAGEKK